LVAASKHLSVDRGAIIAGIVPDCPAEAAGLQIGDVVIRFADQEITDLTDLVQAIRASQIGEEVDIVFVRGNTTRTTSAQLIERPTP
jgi:serine protease DegS